MASVSMESDHKTRTFAELARFVYRSPNWRNLAIPIAGIFLIDYLIIRDIGTVFFGSIASFFLVLIFDWIFVKIARFVFPFRRILFMDFISLAIWSVFFWIAYFIGFMSVDNLIMISVSFVSFVRILILYGYYSDNSSKTIFPSMNYTYAAMLTLLPVMRNAVFIVPFLLSSLVYVIAGAIFVKRSTRKFKEEFNESPTEMIKFFLNYKSVANSDRIGQKFFEKIYRHTRRVPVKIMDISTLEGKRKALLVFPYIHPGPFGRIGTSNLPERLLDRLSDLSGELMVFHTTTTNSNNCSGDPDIDSIAEGVRKAAGHLDYADTISKFKKVAVDKYAVGMQKIGEYGFAALVPENAPFDDVSLSEGMKVMESLAGKEVKDLTLIDAQNHFTEGVRELDDCSVFIPAFRKEFPEMPAKYPARVGYSRITGQMEGLASMGMQALVFNADDSYQAIVLTDSNNVTTEVIEAARRKTESIVGGLEIYTTDNHVVNGASLDMNPLGAKCNVEDLAEMIAEAVQKAIEDIGEVKIGFASETVKVKMGDENSFQNLIDLVYSSVKTAKYTVMVALPLSIVFSILVFYYFIRIV